MTQPAPKTVSPSKLHQAIDRAKELGQEAKQEQTAAQTPEPVISIEIPSDVRTVIDEPVTSEIDVVKPAEIKNGQLMLTAKHLELIRTQIAKDATPQELELFLMMAYRTRLDPLLKQLYFIKYSGKVSYVTSIDGYRIIAHRTGDFAGVDEPKFDRDNNGAPSHCSITVYKIVQGLRCAFSAKVRFKEYTTNQNNWSKMPETMIAKVAEAHALRKAFPNDLSGIYTQDEMDQSMSNSAPKVPAVKMILRSQVFRIKELMEEKGIELEDLKQVVLKNYNQSSMKDLTFKEAENLIIRLSGLASEEKADESFESFVESEESGDLADDVINALG